MEKVFISYSSQDIQCAENVYALLKEHGYDPWMATYDMALGEYPALIVEAIKESSKAIIIISEHSLESPHCYSEIGICFDNHIDMIPYRLDATPYPAGFEYYLKNYQWINGSKNDKESLERLLKVLKATNSTPPKKIRKVIPILAVGFILILMVSILFNLRDNNDLPYCRALSADYGKCLSLSNYHIIRSDTKDYSFAYPKNFFKTGKKTKNGYYFQTGDKKATMRVTRKKQNGDSLKKVKLFFKKEKKKYDCKNEISGIHVISDKEDNRGWSHAIIGGNYLSNPKQAVYLIAAANDDYFYTLRFDYQIIDNKEYYTEQNYVIDCIYRYCSYSGSTHEPREFSSFLIDRNQAD